MAPKNNNKMICDKEAAENKKKKNGILMAAEEEEKKVGSGRRRRSVEFKKQIYEAAKEKNPELEITVESIEMINEMMNDMLHKIVEKAAKNASATASNQLHIKHLYAAVTQLFPEDLAKYANIHGYVSCTNYETHIDHESQQLSDYLCQVKI